MFFHLSSCHKKHHEVLWFRVLDAMKRCPRVDFTAVEKTTGKTVLHEVRH